MKNFQMMNKDDSLKSDVFVFVSVCIAVGTVYITEQWEQFIMKLFIWTFYSLVHSTIFFTMLFDLVLCVRPLFIYIV